MVSYRIASTVLLFLIILASVFAIEVTDVTPQDVTPNSDYAKINAQIQIESAKLNQKIDLMVTKDELKNDLQTHLTIVNNVIDNFKSQLIVGLIITQLATLGLAFGIFFYFKSQRRV